MSNVSDNQKNDKNEQLQNQPNSDNLNQIPNQQQLLLNSSIPESYTQTQNQNLSFTENLQSIPKSNQIYSVPFQPNQVASDMNINQKPIPQLYTFPSDFFIVGPIPMSQPDPIYANYLNPPSQMQYPQLFNPPQIVSQGNIQNVINPNLAINPQNATVIPNIYGYQNLTNFYQTPEDSNELFNESETYLLNKYEHLCMKDPTNMLKIYRFGQVFFGTLHIMGIFFIYGTRILERVKSFSRPIQITLFLFFSYANITLFNYYSKYFTYLSFKKKFQGYDLKSINKMIKGMEEMNLKIR